MKTLARLGLCAALTLTPLAAQAATVAFTGATVIDGTGRAPISDGVVVVRDGKVEAVGPRATVPIPVHAQRVDATGKYIIPGLISAHAHLELTGATTPPRNHLLDQLALYARYGVTTVYSLGDDGVESVRIRDELRGHTPDTRPVVSRAYVSGPVMQGPSVAGGRANVAENAKRGVDITKTRLEGPPTAPIRTPEVLNAMIGQSHADGLRVAAHIFTLDEARSVLAADADILAHSVRDQDVDAALIAKMKAENIGYIPTLTRELSVFVYESTPDFITDPFFTREPAFRAPLARLLTPEVQERYRTNPSAQAIKPALAQALRNLKILSDAGVPIAMGTDSGAPTGRWQGYFEHVEMAMMADAGMTPMQVLVSATGAAAQVMQIDDVVGTLQPGRYGDLLILGANPLDDIKNTRTLEQVWIGGKKLD
jgi:imidazolonepropionase-like amidohydrolase